ncbi:MAG: hypothetical protein HOI66_01260 [Verrucomicrobia bacterium]|jgi:hypothetical protein|nr:hypothetical protein [Verrucomicrobiota bacterium]
MAERCLCLCRGASVLTSHSVGGHLRALDGIGIVTVFCEEEGSWWCWIRRLLRLNRGAAFDGILFVAGWGTGRLPRRRSGAEVFSRVGLVYGSLLAASFQGSE